MRFFHLYKRGDRYHFVCRVPVDLQHRFPTATLWQSLRTNDKKSAKVLVASIEQKTQQLFVQLRSGMLTPEMEQRIVDAYLCHSVQRLECQAVGGEYAPLNECISPADDAISDLMEKFSAWNAVNDAIARRNGQAADNRHRQTELLDIEIRQHRTTLIERSPARHDSAGPLVERISNLLKKQKLKGLGRGLTAGEKNRLAVKISALQSDVANAEQGTLEGDWSLLRQLQDRAAMTRHTPYVPFSEVAQKYLNHYLTTNPHVRPGTRDDVAVECRTLIELVGKRSIADANEMDMVTEIKSILTKYPKSRLQRFGDKSLQTIFKTEWGYKTISLKTANQYLARMSAIIDFAIENRTISTANIWIGKRFKVSTLPEEERLPYSKQDLERLVDALCTKPLWRYKPAKPERFWVILIALLQGVRLDNITGLQTTQIVTADGIPCFDLIAFGSKGVKRAATAQLVPVHWGLIEIGFLKWVEKHKSGALFQDSAAQFSKWYNRKAADGKGAGFESSYVTIDPLKCFHSTRHLFAGEVYDSTGDMKIVKDALGHASDKRNVTNRYTGRAKIERIKAAMDVMPLEGIDVSRLKARAAELFEI